MLQSSFRSCRSLHNPSYTRDGSRTDSSRPVLTTYRILSNALSGIRKWVEWWQHIFAAHQSPKMVQLVPDLTDQALALGRWTTPHTFRNHYQAPVLGTWAKVPKSICNNPQQVLRWGWSPQPPAGISVAEYEKPPSYWVGKTIPSLGKITKFENGDYMVNDLNLKHWEFMGLV